jgi:hypothetical protein
MLGYISKISLPQDKKCMMLCMVRRITFRRRSILPQINLLLYFYIDMINYIQKSNNLYLELIQNYSALKGMYKNHSTILQKLELSEVLLIDTFKLIVRATIDIETKRQFNSIIKGLKNE